MHPADPLTPELSGNRRVVHPGHGRDGGRHGEHVRRTTWVCAEEATELTMPMAVAIDDAGAFVVVSALVPGETEVVPLA